MDFRILGPLEVWHEGRPVPVAGSRQRELLAVLLLHSGQVVSTDRLMDALWGEDQPAAGATALRVRVSQLRKALGPGGASLVTRAPGYALLVEHDGVDLRRFERAVEDATRALARDDAATALEHVRSALSLWRGQPLADFAYAAFAQPAVRRLEELRVAAVELQLEAELALGHHGRVIGELQELVAEHPLRERLWALLMLALYRDGRQAEALAAYRTARDRLVEEVGIEPGPELRALEARLLAQDPGLAGAPVEAPAAAPRRAVLALPDPSDCDGDVTAVAERLAAHGGHELLAVALVGDTDAVDPALAQLRPLRERSAHARVAAFTTADRGADAVRLTAEQDAAVLLISLGAGAVDGDLRTILGQAVCDVVLVGGAASPAADGPVLVPFGGHGHDWSAIEVGAWLAGGAPLRLLGVRERRRDASRLLASASLALQRGMGIAAEPVLVEAGADAVVAAAAGASAVVVGLSDRWTREGIGKARMEIARRAPCPVLLVRRGVRPGGLAPAHALTHFTWSGGA